MLALLMMTATMDDPQTLLKAAAGRLTACAPAGCATPTRRSRFRLDPDPVAATPDAKARALQATGAPCETVGTRYCTRKPRTVFRTDFTD